MWANRRGQKRFSSGSAMVEFSIAVTLFLVIVFGIIQFSMSYYAWNEVSEAARDGARYLLVNTPPISVSGQTCPGGAAVSGNCSSSGSCTGLMSVIQKKASFVKGSQVAVSYACSNSGNPARPASSRVRDVTVTISGVANPFVFWIVPMEGGNKKPSLQTVTETRTGETLFTLAL